MEWIALLISLISLAVAALAWWRAGGQRDLDQVRAKQKELTDTLLFLLEDAYEQSRLSLRQTAEGLQQLKSEAIDEVAQQLHRATQQLAALEQHLEEGLKTARTSALVTAHRVEVELRRRVRRIEARGSLLFAKAAAVLAIRHTRAGELPRAEKRLDEATALLALARETMRADHAYDEQFDLLKRTLAEAINAVRAQAQDIRQHIERVLAETDKLVGALESDEHAAANNQPSTHTTGERKAS